MSIWDGNRQEIEEILDYGLLDDLCPLLESETDIIVSLVLQGLFFIMLHCQLSKENKTKLVNKFEEFDCWNCLLTLSKHSNIKIKCLATIARSFRYN